MASLTRTGGYQIDAETAEGGATKTGKILMVGGRVLAIRGNIATPGNEIDAIDSALLQYQAVLRMLSAALPDGPVGLKGVRKIDFSNETGIQVATKSAQWLISAVACERKRQSGGPGVVEYELALTAGLKGKPESEAAGRGNTLADYPKSRPRDWTIDGARRLDLFWVGPYAKKVVCKAIYDYGQRPSDFHKTVGGIRGRYSQKRASCNYPGQLDASKDFGSGKRSAMKDSECRSSAMDRMAEHHRLLWVRRLLDRSRLELITGDKKHYEVVSADELAQINLDGSKTTYHRCTRDTHPILKTRSRKSLRCGFLNWITTCPKN